MNTNHTEPRRPGGTPALIRCRRGKRWLGAVAGGAALARGNRLSMTFVAGLVLKSALVLGRPSRHLVERHCLSLAVLDDVFAFLVREHLVSSRIAARPIST